MAHPRKEKVVGIRLDEQTHERLQAVVRRVRGRTVSAYITALLERALDEALPVDDETAPETAQAA